MPADEPPSICACPCHQTEAGWSHWLSCCRHPERADEPPFNSRKLLWAVTDDIWDHASLDEPWAEWFIENIEEPVKALICAHEGHVVIDDQCMIPEHRYCAVCGKGMGNVPTTA